MTLQLYLSVQNWTAEFGSRRECLDDDPLIGRPATDTSEEIIDPFHCNVMGDRPLTVTKITNAIISCMTVENILRKEVGMKKAFAMSVPH